MTSRDDLARKLRVAYANGSGKGKVVSVHLFGIQHADEIATVSLDDLTRKAAVPDSYRTEIRKMMKLARYVSVK